MQAHLGGVPSHKGQIQAFMRLGEKGGVPFDFDAPGGQDTTWQRVFLCLRSGYFTEACEVSHWNIWIVSEDNDSFYLIPFICPQK